MKKRDESGREFVESPDGYRWYLICPRCGVDRSGLLGVAHDFGTDCPRCRPGPTGGPTGVTGTTGFGKRVSCRRSALRAGDRAGRFAGMLVTSMIARERMSSDHAHHLANYAAGDYAVPAHWRQLFVRAFVKSALSVVRADTARSKYGVA